MLSREMVERRKYNKSCMRLVKLGIPLTRLGRLCEASYNSTSISKFKVCLTGLISRT